MSKVLKFNIKLDVNGKEQVVAATADVKKLQKSIDGVRRRNKRTAASFFHLNQKIQTVTQAFNGLNEAGNILKGITADSRAFADAMLKANTMAGMSGEEFEGMKNKITELSKEIPVARDALANGLYQVVSNGVPKENWLTFLEQSSRSAVGGCADLQKVVTVTSTVIKNYGLSWDKAQEIQDKIQLTARNGVTSFEQLAEALPRVTGNAATLGVQIEELFASFATLTGVSGNTNEVATQMAAVLSALVKPSSEATKMAAEMGIQFDAMAVKSAGGLQSFLTSLDRSVKAYSASSGILEQEVYAKLFGSAEALRALIPLNGELADKFSENVASMKDSAGTIDEAYSEMTKSSETKLQLLKNKMSEVTDSIANMAEAVAPYLSYAAQIGSLLTGLVSLTKVISVTTKAITGSKIALAVWSGVVVKTRTVMLTFSAMLTFVKAKFHGVAVGATTAKIAVRGFLASTGVGVLVVALGLALEKLISYFDDTAEAADGANESMRRSAQGLDVAKKAAEQSKQTFDSMYSQTLARLRSSFTKLQGEWASLRTEAEKRSWIKENQSLFNELGLSVNSLADAEDVFVKQTGKVEQAFIRRARAAAAQSAITEEMERQIRLKQQIDESNARTKEGMRVKAGDMVDMRKHKNLNYSDGSIEKGKWGAWYWTEKGAKQRNAYADTLISNGQWTNNLRTAYDESCKRVKAFTQVLTESTAEIAKATNKGGTGGATSAVPAPISEAQSAALPEPKLIVPAAFTQDVTTAIKQGLSLPELKNALSLKDSVGLFDNYRREQYEDAQRKVQSVQQDVEIGILGEEEAMQVIDEINEKLKELGINPIEIEVKESGFSKAIGNIQEGWSAVQGVVGGFDQLKESLQSNGSAWEKFSGIMNGTLSILSSIEPILKIINMLTTISTTKKKAETIASQQKSAANAGEAITETVKSGAKLPFPANIAAIAAGVAAVVGAIAMVAGAFADGGIVGGSSRSGDRLLARVNSGEMILNSSQQARLFSIANGAAVTSPRAEGLEVGLPLDRLRSLMEPNTAMGGNVEFRIKGRELVGVLSREGNYRQRT